LCTYYRLPEAIKPILETISAKFIFIIFLYYLLALCGVDQTHIIIVQCSYGTGLGQIYPSLVLLNW